MSEPDRDDLIENIVGHASDDVARETQLRVVAYWWSVDPQLGARVAAGLGIEAESANGDLGAAREKVAERANRA